ncbi:DUF4328 domain-containing protein [Nocardia asiatica]|uniref:DUF4328 domain-containing protein n=1 Tax=Nocardia asiatica TaxID=209252 RepID=UPI000300119E|nr:DUF4328 domain-containing protein [Nocardia asiatica]
MQVEFSGRDDADYVRMTSAHRPGPPSFGSVLGWSVAVILAAAAVVVAHAVEVAGDWRNYQLLLDYENDLSSTEEYLRKLQDQTASSWGWSIALPAQLVCGVLFVIWTYRSRRNAEVLCAAPHRLPRAWAVAGFLPIVNWLLPPLVIDDIQRASDPATPTNARRLAANSTTPLVVLWWIGFITGSILLFVAYLLGVAPRLGTAGTDLAALGMLAGFSGMLSLGAAAVTLAVILLRVTRWQEARAPLAATAEDGAEMEPPVSVRPDLAQHAAPPPVRPLEPVGVLGTVAAGLSLASVAGPAIVAMAASGYGEGGNAKKGTPEYEAAMDDWAPLMLFGLLTWTLTVFVAGSLFLFWLLRARINAEIVNPAAQRLGRGWVLGGWFVPVGNTIIPAVVVDDVYRVSHHGSTSIRWPVVVWWLAWVAAWTVAAIGLAYLVPAMLWTATALFALAAALLTTVVMQIDRGQQRAALAHSRVASPESGSPLVGRSTA